MALMVDIIDNDTRAYIGNGVTLRVGGAVAISATAGLDFWSLAASVGVSSSEAGIAGSFGILVYGQNVLESGDGVRAYIGSGVTTTAVTGGSISLTASAPNTYKIITGNIAIGSEAGVGVSAAILVASGRVSAMTADGATLTATTGSIALGATQSERTNLVAIGGSGGGTAGVAGSAAWTSSRTPRRRASATTRRSARRPATSRSPRRDTTDILGLAGTIGFGGTAGVGAGVDVEVISKTTTASVGTNATLDARRQPHDRRDLARDVHRPLDRWLVRRHGRRHRERGRVRHRA